MAESTWLVVPCPARRYFELLRCLGSFEHPLERTVIVTAEPDAIWADDLPVNLEVVKDTVGSLSFSRWYNLAADLIDRQREHSDDFIRPFEIFYTGSDSWGNARSIAWLRDVLRLRDYTAVGPNLGAKVKADVPRQPGEKRTLWNRLPGASLMLKGELGLRMDERFRWWYSDDDLETQAAALGPVCLVAGSGVQHPNDHMLSEEQARWAEEDRALYVEKWGMEPW